jgi:hypothetical protein
MNKIAFLNDGLRRTFARGKVVMTQGVASLPEDVLTTVLERVRHFDEFTPDNDPHGEHDFGNFDVAGVRYFFKVDYYSLDMHVRPDVRDNNIRCERSHRWPAGAVKSGDHHEQSQTPRKHLRRHVHRAGDDHGIDDAVGHGEFGRPASLARAAGSARAQSRRSHLRDDGARRHVGIGSGALTGAESLRHLRALYKRGRA